MNKKILALSLKNISKKWKANFQGLQSWAYTLDYLGGHSWLGGNGVLPTVFTAENKIKWQNYNSFYSSGYLVAHFIESTLSKLIPGIIEGSMVGYQQTGSGTETTSYNFFCSNAAYASDDGNNAHIRNTNGLSFTVCSYSTTIVVKAYLNNVLLGVIGSIPNNSTYTIKFKIVGNKLLAAVETGDTTSVRSSLTTISNNVNQNSLIGTNMIIFISSSIWSDQSPFGYGEINKISISNNS